MPVTVFFGMVKDEEERELREEKKRQWDAMLPFMALGRLKYVAFEDYFDEVTGRNIDTRPAEEILAEVEKIKKEFADGNL